MGVRREEVIRRGNEWIHKPTNSRAWLEEIRTPVVGVSDEPIRQPKIHVFVPEEHRGKNIGAELLKLAVKDLEKDNFSLPKKDRVYRVFVELSPHVHHDDLNAAIETLRKAGFSSDGSFFYYKLKNFDNP